MKIHLVMLGAALVFLGGCASETGALAPANGDKFNQETQAKFVLMDGAVQHSVTTSAIQETHLADGRLQVGVVLRNRKGAGYRSRRNVFSRTRHLFPQGMKRHGRMSF